MPSCKCRKEATFSVACHLFGAHGSDSNHRSFLAGLRRNAMAQLSSHLAA